MSESIENNMNTEESNASITSAEDKFFGVKTQIVKNSKEKQESNEADDFDLEIVDDKPPVKKASEEPTGDEELDNYSASVRKRLDKATFKRREAERLAEEAVAAAQQLNQQNQNLSAKNKEYESLINRGETALVSQIKQKAKLAAEKAKAEYKKAHEEGNTDEIVSSQEKMIEAQSQMQEAERYERSLPAQPTQQQQAAYQQQLAYQQQQQQAYQQQQQQSVNSVPEPEPKAKEWGEKNTWFGDEEHKGMTAYAYALHEEAIKDNGLSPNSDQYFEYIDNGMRGRFSEYEWLENTSKNVSDDGQTAPSTTAQPSSVVAPSARNNGAKPRKMKLTSTQVSLAKRLGLTNAQYANQLVKEMTNGR
jgi:hypothetical protein|tara:strand:- start:401 stop:1489 length:1089 start_codon:yes stop_codon:yes gene_type:complete